MYQMYWFQSPQICTQLAPLWIRKLLLEIASCTYHIFSKNLSLGTSGGRAVEVSLCCTISQFHRYNCCWDELRAKYGQCN